MENDKIKKLWAISLMVTGIGGLLLSVLSIFGIKLPDVIALVVLVCGLAAVAALIYSSIRLISGHNKF